jgi:hypothetical protein
LFFLLTFLAFRAEKYQPSKDQQEKISKKGELQQELAKLEQYYVRLTNREKLLQQESQPPLEEKKEFSTSTKVVDETRNKDERSRKARSGSEEMKDSLSTTASSSLVASTAPVPVPAVSQKSKKKRFLPFDLSTGLPLAPPPEDKTVTVVPPSAGLNAAAPPLNFSQWSTVLAAGTPVAKKEENEALLFSTPTKKEPVAATVGTISTTQTALQKKPTATLSSSFNGRTVLSPPEKQNSISSLSLAQVAPSPVVVQQQQPSVSGSGANFSLLDFMTPKKSTPLAKTAVTPSTTTVVSSSPALSKGLIARQLLNEQQGRSPSATTTTITTANPPTVSSNAWKKPETPSPVVAVKPQVQQLSQSPLIPSSSTSSSKNMVNKPNFMQIQQEEEFLRQNSDLQTLKGNEIPWRIDRQLKNNSLQTLMAQELIAKQENDEIMREYHRFEAQEKEKEKAKESGKKRANSEKGKGSRGGGKDSGPHYHSGDGGRQERKGSNKGPGRGATVGEGTVPEGQPKKS